MQWNSSSTPAVQLLPAAQAKSYCLAHPIEAYQLVDVRQPGEYASGHLPGATLLPLDQVLSNQTAGLDPDKPTLVYCHAGRRSAMAAGWLAQNGFLQVYDIQGGYAAWVGLSAAGPVDLNVELIPTSAHFEDALSLAHAMEAGLQDFYQRLAERTKNSQFKEILTRLAGFEDHHLERLQQKGARPNEAQTGLMEGGFAVERMVEQLAPRLVSLEELFSLALAIEAQAYDFYTRLQKRALHQETRMLFTEMANEEKEHLNLLAREFDQRLAEAAVH